MSDEQDPGTITFPAFARCRFGASGPLYDFKAPFPVSIGQRVVVETRHGTTKVTVAEIMAECEAATASIIDVVPEPKEDEDGE